MGGYNPVYGREPWTEFLTVTCATEDPAYPASNLITPDLNEVFRSNATSLTVIEWTTPRDLPLGMVVIQRHKMSQGADLRLEIFADTDLSVARYDSDLDPNFIGGRAVWPTSYSFDQLDLEDDNWLTWQYRSEELANKTWDRPIWLDDARYMHRGGRLTLRNPFNALERIQFGRLDASRAAQTSRGLSMDTQSGFDPQSIVSTAKAGKKYGQQIMSPRVCQTTFQSLPRAEAELFKVQKHSNDIVPEKGMYWHPFPKEPGLWLLNSFWARNAAIPLHGISAPLRDSVPVSLEEIM